MVKDNNNCTDHSNIISGILKDVEYMKEEIKEIKKMREEFYNFKTEIKTAIHIWGIMLSSLFTIASVLLKSGVFQ